MELHFWPRENREYPRRWQRRTRGPFRAIHQTTRIHAEHERPAPLALGRYRRISSGTQKSTHFHFHVAQSSVGNPDFLVQVYTFEAGQDNKDNKVVATRAREYPAQRDKGKMIRLGSKIISPKRLLEIALSNSLNGKSYNIRERNCQAWSVSHVFFLITYRIRFPCEINDGLLLEMP